MDAPNKENAKNILQFNEFGIGGSHNGFNGPYTVGMTLDGTLIGERLKVGSVKAEALSVEYKASVSDEITSKFKVTEDLISAEVTRATDKEIDLAASIKVTSELVQTKVSKGEFGSYMQQFYDYFLLGFNESSKYVQINPGEIAIYDNGVTNSKKRATFDQNGNHFYRDGYNVGVIGTSNYVNDKSIRGLVFDIEDKTSYMAWGSKPENQPNYILKWTYASKSFAGYNENTLNAGCDIDMHNFKLRNVEFENVLSEGNVAWTGQIHVITDVYNKGNGEIGYETKDVFIKDGIVQIAL